MSHLRSQVINLYKNLLYYANDYPLGYTYYRNRLKKSFQSNSHVQDTAQIAKLIERGNFVILEIEALYKLKKYRSLKRSYYDENATQDEALKKFIQNLTKE
jgi:hypothetical protein